VTVVNVVNVDCAMGMLTCPKGGARMSEHVRECGEFFDDKFGTMC